MRHYFDFNQEQERSGPTRPSKGFSSIPVLFRVLPSDSPARGTNVLINVQATTWAMPITTRAVTSYQAGGSLFDQGNNDVESRLAGGTFCALSKK